jgi:predicted peroxiredoxin
LVRRASEIWFPPELQSVPYPFAPMPTTAEAVARLATVGVEEGIEVSGGITFHYLTREVDGRRRFAVFPDVGPEDRLTPAVLSSVCKQLGVDVRLFGFTLGSADDD